MLRKRYEAALNQTYSGEKKRAGDFVKRSKHQTVRQKTCKPHTSDREHTKYQLWVLLAGVVVGIVITVAWIQRRPLLPPMRERHTFHQKEHPFEYSMTNLAFIDPMMPPVPPQTDRRKSTPPMQAPIEMMLKEFDQNDKEETEKDELEEEELQQDKLEKYEEYQDDEYEYDELEEEEEEQQLEEKEEEELEELEEEVNLESQEPEEEGNFNESDGFDFAAFAKKTGI